MSVVTLTLLSEGQALDSGQEVVSVDVLREINRIPYAEIRLRDGDAARQEFAISNSVFFEPGKTIEIKARYEGEPGTEATVFKGLAVTHGIVVEGRVSLLVVELKDPAIRLTQARRSRVFQDLSDDGIAKRLIDEAGLKAGQIAATKPTHKALVQYGCTDWDFLMARAEANGLLVRVIDGTVDLGKITLEGAVVREFVYGLDEILGLEIEVDAGSQVAEATLSAWDPKNQSVLEGRGGPAPSVTPGNLDGARLAKKIGDGAVSLLSSSALDKQELQGRASALVARSRLALIRGRISVPGTHDVAPLDTVAIKGVGDRFNGKALVTAVRDRIDLQGWVTDVQFGLGAAPFVERPGVAAPPAAGLLPPISGLQIGVVEAIQDDPDKELRVQVRLPVLGPKAPPLWARWATPDAGKSRGYVFRPEPGDEVVMGFVDEDPRQPVILGALFGSKNAPPDRFGQPQGTNPQKGWVTRSGISIAFDDEKKQVSIETPGKNRVVLDDDAKKIELADQHGNSIVMDDQGITINSAKALAVKAKQKVEIGGSEVDIQ
jgi:phage protein D/phage baseplate assembly protein gpV